MKKYLLIALLAFVLTACSPSQPAATTPPVTESGTEQPEVMPPVTEPGTEQPDSSEEEIPLPEILDRTDKVVFEPFSFLVNGVEVTNETLAELRIYKITATAVGHNGGTEYSDYTGYKLADVLEACGLASCCVQVKTISSDGWEAELDGDLVTSDHTLIAIEKNKELGEEGTVWLAPCSVTSAKSYCKLVVEIIAE